MFRKSRDMREEPSSPHRKNIEHLFAFQVFPGQDLNFPWRQGFQRRTGEWEGALKRRPSTDILEHSPSTIYPGKALSGNHCETRRSSNFHVAATSRQEDRRCPPARGTLLSAPTRRSDLDHIGSYNFRVEIDGVDAGHFSGVEGLDSETEVIEFQDGDDIVLRKRPGRVKYGDITLKRGTISTEEMREWWQSLRTSDFQRKALTIILQDNNGRPVRSWQAHRFLAEILEGQQPGRQG